MHVLSNKALNAATAAHLVRVILARAERLERASFQQSPLEQTRSGSLSS